MIDVFKSTKSCWDEITNFTYKIHGVETVTLNADFQWNRVKTNSVKQSPCRWETNQEIPRPLWSPKLFTSPRPEPDESNPHLPTVFP
jgi:hypothetical protein